MEPTSAFNTLDSIVIGFVLGSGLLALMRGFVRELFSLAGWVVAYFAATHFYPVAVPWVKHYIKSDNFAEWGAMAVVFVAALILTAIIGAIVASFINGRALTAIDRSLGFLYGLLRGAVVVCAIYFGAVTIFWPGLDKPMSEQQAKEKTNAPDILIHAKTHRALAFGASKLAALIPNELVDKTLRNLPEQKKQAQKEVTKQALDALGVPQADEKDKAKNDSTPKPASSGGDHLDPALFMQGKTQ